MRNLVLIGGGGHCKSVIDVVEQISNYKILGFVDKPELRDTRVMGYSWIGTDNELCDLLNDNTSFHITIGQIKSNIVRKKIFNQLLEMNANIAVIISPMAKISRTCEIGSGTIVMNSCIVNADAKIGVNCIINNCSIIEHDVIIGNHSHISTGAIINGSTSIGENCFIGSGAIISNQITITSNTIIGAGSFVRNSIFQPGVYAGNPLRQIC